MSHIPVLIHDLAIILFSAGIITIIFKWLKQPVVLGYIVAGLLAGPYICGSSWIGDEQSIKIWGDIGVIFLLFALGLEFSFRKLLNVGISALTGALTIVIGMMTTGFLTGQLLGWNSMNSLFLGGMLSMSSTTIVFKALDDMNLRSQYFAKLVFGILIVEDLFAVLLMVILSTVAVSNEFEGGELLSSVIKLGAYLLFWFVGGIFIIPTFLKKVKKYLNDETLLVVSLGFCLGMVILAVQAGFSSALGAFVMGSILAETLEAERIESLVKPVKDLFGAIFFVSVGMMIDPSMLVNYWFPILLITLVVIAGQIFYSSFGVLISGQPLKTAIQCGFSLAQIGEFAFIIASLGLSLKVTAPFLYPIVVAVSVITTFLTPYTIKLSSPAYTYINDRLSVKTKRRLDKYCSGVNAITKKSTWNILIKSLAEIVLIYGVITLLIIIVYLKYVPALLSSFLPLALSKFLSVFAILIIVSPFLRAIMMKKNHSEEFNELWLDNRHNRAPLVGLILLRVLLCLGCVMFIIARVYTLTSGVLFAIATAVIVFFITSKQIKKQSITLERRFLRNLRARQVETNKKSPIKEYFAKSLLSKDLHLADFEVGRNSKSVGKRLKELDLKKKFGVSVVRIIRGDKRINIPGGNEFLFPFDKIVVAGTDVQLNDFKLFVEENDEDLSAESTKQHNITLEQFIVEADSVLEGKSILQSGIRDKACCLVIGVERDSKSLMNPQASFTFQEGDIVMVAGERDKLENLLNEVEEEVKTEAAPQWIVKQ